MNGNDIRSEALKSLMESLPNIANSLNQIVSRLREIIKEQQDTPEKTVEMTVLNDEVKIMIALMQKVLPLRTHEGAATARDMEIVALHRRSIGLILDGLTMMLGWLVDQEKPLGSLEKSINLLYDASQKLVQLVNVLTQEE